MVKAAYHAQKVHALQAGCHFNFAVQPSCQSLFSTCRSAVQPLASKRPGYCKKQRAACLQTSAANFCHSPGALQVQWWGNTAVKRSFGSVSSSCKKRRAACRCRPPDEQSSCCCKLSCGLQPHRQRSPASRCSDIDKAACVRCWELSPGCCRLQASACVLGQPLGLTFQRSEQHSSIAGHLLAYRSIRLTHHKAGPCSTLFYMKWL